MFYDPNEWEFLGHTKGVHTQNAFEYRRRAQPLTSTLASSLANVGGADVSALRQLLTSSKENVLEAIRRDPVLQQKLEVALPAICALAGEIGGKAMYVALEKALKKPGR